MAISIVSVTVGSADNCLQLDNCTAYRQLSVGTSWTELFVAIGCCILDTTPPTLGSQFKLGMTTAGVAYDAVSGKNFVGCGVNAGTNWSNTANACTALTGCGWVERVDGTLYEPNSQSHEFTTQSKTTTMAHWNGLMFHVKKISSTQLQGSIMSGGINSNSLSATIGFDLQRCILAAETGTVAGAAAIIGATFTSNGLGTYTSNLGSGGIAALNAIGMFWNRSSSLMKVGHIVIGKWS